MTVRPAAVQAHYHQSSVNPPRHSRLTSPSSSPPCYDTRTTHHNRFLPTTSFQNVRRYHQHYQEFHLSNYQLTKFPSRTPLQFATHSAVSPTPNRHQSNQYNIPQPSSAIPTTNNNKSSLDNAKTSSLLSIQRPPQLFLPHPHLYHSTTLARPALHLLSLTVLWA